MIKLKKSLPIFILLVFVLLAIRFLFLPGFYTFHDESHLANLYEMGRIIKEGQIPPRWAPDFNFNFGYPFFTFNYVLPYYIGTIPYLMGFDLMVSLKTSFGLSMILSAISFFLLASHLFSKTTALGMSLLYIYTPYRALNLYVRGAAGEMWAFVFLPLVILGVIRLKDKLNFLNFSLVSFSLAGLMISHNLTSLIFIPLAFLLIIFLGKKDLRYLITAGGALLGGFLLASFYWIPAFLELSYVKSGTPFNPVDHFPTIKQLILPFWGFGGSTPGSGDDLSFQIGVANLLAIILGVAGFILGYKKLSLNHRYLGYWLGLVFILVIFLMNFRSAFIWQNIHLLSYIQFPWRLLALTTFISALMLGYLENFKKGKLSLVVGFLAVILTWQYFIPENQVNFSEDDYLKRFFINRSSSGYTTEQSPIYHQNSEDYLPMLKSTNLKPTALPPKVQTEDKEVVLETKEHKSTDWQVGYKSPNDFKLTFNSYFYPGWTAALDGNQIPIGVEEPHGQMIFDLPRGEHILRVQFKETTTRQAVNIISVLTFAVLIILSLKNIWVKK